MCPWAVVFVQEYDYHFFKFKLVYILQERGKNSVALTSGTRCMQRINGIPSLFAWPVSTCNLHDALCSLATAVIGDDPTASYNVGAPPQGTAVGPSY